jgi:hypothetical protein
MTTDEPFPIDNSGLGDLESEQLYLEVKTIDIVHLSFDIVLLSLVGSQYTSETSIGQAYR